MQPTTSGRFRVHDRRPRPDVGGGDGDHSDVDGGNGSHPDVGGGDGDDVDVAAESSGGDRTEARAPEEFVLVELPDEPIDPTDPNAADAYDPLYVSAGGYADDLADRVASLDPGTVVDATLAWDDGTARFSSVAVVREDRFRFADGVEGMFEAAVEEWRRIRADGESIGSVTTRSNDGEPNGALYLFADAPGTDVFADLRAGRLPIEPLIARVNARRADGTPREVFVFRPAAHAFVAVHVVLDREGVLARTVRDTYDLGEGLAAGLDPAGATGAVGGAPGRSVNPRAGSDAGNDRDGDKDGADRSRDDDHRGEDDGSDERDGGDAGDEQDDSNERDGDDADDERDDVDGGFDLSDRV